MARKHRSKPVEPVGCDSIATNPVGVPVSASAQMPQSGPMSTCQQTGQRRRWKSWLLGGVLVLILTGWFRPDAGLALWWGEAVAESDPAFAEELFQWSLYARGGQYPAAYLAWARLLAARGEWPEALGCFGRIQDPTQCDPAALLAFAKSAQRGPNKSLAEKAFAAANRPSGNRPGAIQAQVLKEWLAFKIQQHDWSAVEALATQLEALEPKCSVVWSSRARLHVAQGDFDRALQEFQTAIMHEADVDASYQLRLEWLQLLLHLRQTAAARECLEQFPSTFREQLEVQVKEVWLCRLEGELERALQIAESASSKHQGSNQKVALLELRHARGVVLLDLGQHAAAIADLEWVIDRAPQHLEARYKLAVALKQAGRDAEAETQFNRVRSLEADRLRAMTP